MPTYDYECGACGHEFEKFQSITAPAVRKCPQCKKLKVRRLIGTGAGVIFKGSGFYTTDYKNNSHKTPDPKNKKKEAEPSSASEAKNEPAKGSDKKSETAKK